MKNYKDILIDADDTIFDFGKCERNAFFLSARKMGIEVSENVYSKYSEINKSLWKAHERKEITREEIQSKRYTELLRFLGKDDREGENWNRYYVEELANQAALFEESETACRELAKHFRLSVITNGIDFVQHNRINMISFKEVFSYVFISGEIGYTKPDVRFFETAAAIIPCFEKDKAVVVGDSVTSDIAGANNFGVDAILIDREDKHGEQDLQIIARLKDLNELCKYLSN
ncbi:MAG: YjjG family noncanonical pyrimidine nucleotidase [Clostridia bacterium]|nr:YjjG family noncanonical pyrimidine nucleotidase [Clostridia bacterium]